MRAIIGAKLIASKEAAPTDKPFEIRDTRLPGFIPRVQPSGYRSYYAEWARGQPVSRLEELLPHSWQRPAVAH